MHGLKALHCGVSNVAFALMNTVFTMIRRLSANGRVASQHLIKRLVKPLVLLSLVALPASFFATISVAEPAAGESGAAASDSATAIDPLVPDGALHVDTAIYQYALYVDPRFIAEYKGDVTRLAMQQAEKFLTGFVVQNADPAEADTAVMQDGKNVATVFVLTDAQQSYPPPAIEKLRFKGLGITPVQARGLRNVTTVITITFALQQSPILPAYKMTNEFMTKLAGQAEGLLWDEETGEVMSPEFWEIQRNSTWQQDTIPDIEQHITMHAYQSDSSIRIVTLGLNKFGLPDVSVPSVSRNAAPNVGAAIQTMAQHWVENLPATVESHRWVVDLNTIQHKRFAERYRSNVADNGKFKATAILRAVKPRPGDNPNRQLRMSGELYADEVAESGSEEPITEQADRAGLDQLAIEIFGEVDRQVLIDRNKRLLAASDRAQQQLPALRKHFQKGLQPAELIMVKAPFATDDGGAEWLWVHVKSWEEEVIRGVLPEDAKNIVALKTGTAVKVRQQDVFDYYHQLPNGQVLGNETAPIIAEMEGQ